MFMDYIDIDRYRYYNHLEIIKKDFALNFKIFAYPFPFFQPLYFCSTLHGYILYLLRDFPDLRLNASLAKAIPHIGGLPYLYLNLSARYTSLHLPTFDLRYCTDHLGNTQKKEKPGRSTHTWSSNRNPGG